MKKQDYIAFWIFGLTASVLIKDATTKHNYLDSVLASIGVGLFIWPITCYKRTLRAKITTIVALALTPIFGFLTFWAFDTPPSFLDNPFLYMFVLTSLLWWHASRNDKKSALKG